jgi:hypothetical protein
MAKQNEKIESVIPAIIDTSNPNFWQNINYLEENWYFSTKY